MKKYLIVLRNSTEIKHVQIEAISFEYAMYKAKNQNVGFEIISAYIEHSDVRKYIADILKGFNDIYENL